MDTHILIWLALEPENLSDKVRKILADRKNEIYFSVVSFWEVSIKYANGKLKLQSSTPDELHEGLLFHGFKSLPLRTKETVGFYHLDMGAHKDPFDKMLVWQALKNNLILITDDKLIKKNKPENLQIIY